MRRILLGGLLGGLAMIAWLIVADGMFGLKRDVEMNRLAAEREVYTFLAGRVTVPGRYVCNPVVLPGQRYPGHDPIFVVQYSGLGHDDAGQEMLLGLVVAFLAAATGAWLLANASHRIRSHYATRLLFLTAVGAIIALLSLAARFSISAYPFQDAFLLAVYDLAGWVLTSCVLAGVVRSPRTQEAVPVLE